MFNRNHGREPVKTSTKKFSGPEIPLEEIRLIEPHLGEGCFGKVYKGWVHANLVAVKVPHIQDLDESEMDALRSEVELMSATPHENICLFMGACTQPGAFRIVTELMDGDLESLLHSKHRVSLFDRMRMAKGAAQGMAWLHCIDPPIIHRDVKTANLLIKKEGNRYKVKVCDFGLAAIKPKKHKALRDGKDGAKGTPLYMAPEVMMGKAFNEKADVYSFGIVLWEIQTRKDPFPHHNDYDVFVDAVCRKNERPPIPSSTLPLLASLIERCWDKNPKKRPEFTEICDTLDEILVQSAVSDAQGREFWATYFLKDYSPKWDDFATAFYKFLGQKKPTDTNAAAASVGGVYEMIDSRTSEDDVSLASIAGSSGGAAAGAAGGPRTVSPDVVNLRLLEALFCKSDFGESVVPLTHFGELLNWFGPLDRSLAVPHSFLDNIRYLVSQPWFHGDIDAAAAQLKLEGQPVGSFLVRFSSSPGAYTITRKSERGVGNVRIGHVAGKGFMVASDKTFDSLEALIEALGPILHLQVACPGARFQALIQDIEPEIAGYEVMG